MACPFNNSPCPFVLLLHWAVFHVFQLEEMEKFVLIYAMLKLQLIHGKTIIFVKSVDRSFKWVTKSFLIHCCNIFLAFCKTFQGGWFGWLLQGEAISGAVWNSIMCLECWAANGFSMPYCCSVQWWVVSSHCGFWWQNPCSPCFPRIRFQAIFWQEEKKVLANVLMHSWHSEICVLCGLLDC